MVLSTWKPYLPFGLRLLCICASCTPMSSALSGLALPPMFRCSNIAKQPDAVSTEREAGESMAHERNSSRKEAVYFRTIQPYTKQP